MATNTSAGTPVPTLGDVPNVPADMLKLATYLDPVTIPRFVSTAAANTAFPTPITGQQANIAGVPMTWDGTTWVANNPSVQTYTPGWFGSVANPSNASKTAFYKIQGGYCFVSIFMSFPTPSNGGSGSLTVGLPVAANASMPEQLLSCKLFSAAGIVGNWIGVAIIPASSTTCRPQFVLNSDSSVLTDWKGEVSAGSGPGTGTPAIPGQYTVHDNANIAITGIYRI